MTRGRLLRLTVEGFKSFKTRTEVRFKPLTVILGRNNSGKSSLIQSLLLLKQTLAEPRPEVPLHLDGAVSAFHLRELTWGWPGPGDQVAGPEFWLRWACDVDIDAAVDDAKHPDVDNLVRWTKLLELRDIVKKGGSRQIVTEIGLRTKEDAGTTVLVAVWLKSPGLTDAPLLRVANSSGKWRCFWRGRSAEKIEVELDHFLPYLRLDRRNVGPRHHQRAWHNAYLILFARPIESLKQLLAEFQYLGSTRSVPPSLYRPSNVAPNEIGASGELAAQLLHRRQDDVVHFLPPLEVSVSEAAIPPRVRERPLVDAVNEVLSALSIRDPLTVEEVQQVGFRLLFGSASLLHVGRGLTYLLPLVELGLFADPLRFQSIGDELRPSVYRKRCPGFTHVAIEEPEAHLHPKVQSRLAHWLVSLAMSNRRLIIETHSDHLVRRLRGLAARAGAGTTLEGWLLKNVTILEVEQDEEGRSTVTSSGLTAEGGIERWPADFMDEASEEDGAIYYAKLDKTTPETAPGARITFIDGEEPEQEYEP